MRKAIKGNIISLGAIQGIVLLFVLISAVAHKQSITIPIRIFAYQFFAIYLTGFALSKLLRVQITTFSEHIAISYTLGGVISLLTYMAFMLLGMRTAMPVIVCLESLLACIFLFFHKESNWRFEIDQFSNTTCILLLIAWYILTTVIVSFANTLPNETGGTGYYVDWPFWVGNNISFTKSFPADNFRMVGTEFKYHFFSSIFYAQASLSTGVDIVELSFYYSYIFSGIILVFSACYFVTRILKKRALIALGILIILFSSGNNATMEWHLIICPFGFDFGYAYSMMAVATLIEILNGKKWEYYFPLSAIYLAMTTGCKGPSGLVILIGFGVAGIYFLCHKETKKGIISGVVWLVAFLSVFLLFVYSFGGSEETENGLAIVGFNRVVRGIYNGLIPGEGQLIRNIPLAILATLLYWFESNLVATGLVVIAMVKFIVDLIKKRSQIIPLILETIALFGMCLMVITEQNGNSQSYFFMGMIPFGAIAGLEAIERIEKETYKKGLLITASILFGISFTRCYDRLLPKMQQGMKYITRRYTEGDYPLDDVYARYYADKEDYEAYIWLRDNTDINDIIAADSFITIHGKECNMLAGVFSERFIWNEEKYSGYPAISRERNAVVVKLNDHAEETIRELKEFDVKFLLIRTKQDIQCSQEAIVGTKIVFENSHYVIFEILP